jgi:hypothetical protein
VKIGTSRTAIEKLFGEWCKWGDFASLDKAALPGVYALMVSDKDWTGRGFTIAAEIVYFGMTNAKAGLRGRLKQFENTIQGKTGHGGAERVRNRHRDYHDLVRRLYVAIAPFEANVTSNHPEDLRVMGRVAEFEYLCFAAFVEAFGRLPEFNDKKRSPKGKSNE